LTTVFTPPPECTIPVIEGNECNNEDQLCLASFVDSFELITGARQGMRVQCMPTFTTDMYGNVYPITFYSPGIFCPAGMTTAAIDEFGTTYCCHSGMTCAEPAAADLASGTICRHCMATLTMGTFALGASQYGVMALLTTIIFLPEDNFTAHVYDGGVTLVPQNTGSGSNAGGDKSSQDNLIDSSDLTTTTIINEHPTVLSSLSTTFPSSQIPPSTTNPSQRPIPTSESRSPLDSKAVRIGAGIGGAIAANLLLALIYVLMTRYRHKRLHPRNLHHDSNTTPTRSSVGRWGFWNLKPELDTTVTRAELEGTTPEERGAGIYVWKPELEGAAVAPGLLDVYVKRKAELEAREQSEKTASEFTIIESPQARTEKTASESPANEFPQARTYGPVDMFYI
ncbi:hypothetical protein HD806DRAFT_550218, partial [Xylariaceae sp. AK1471]